MSLSCSSSLTASRQYYLPVSTRVQSNSSTLHNSRARTSLLVVRCETTEQHPGDKKKPTTTTGCEDEKKIVKLGIGSPVIIREAPKMVKTATSVPCLRVNSGMIKTGDVGRIVSRKPMDVWAVRLSVGTYLIDGKYFEPLDLEN